MDDSALASVNA